MGGIKRVPGDSSFDAAVVGGGLLGCAVALFLARNGMKTALVERGGLCREASGVNAGTLTMQMTRAALIPYALEAHRMWASAREWLGHDVGVTACDGLSLAFTEGEAALLEGAGARPARGGSADPASRSCGRPPDRARPVAMAGPREPLRRRRLRERLPDRARLPPRPRRGWGSGLRALPRHRGRAGRGRRRRVRRPPREPARAPAPAPAADRGAPPRPRGRRVAREDGRVARGPAPRPHARQPARGHRTPPAGDAHRGRGRERTPLAQAVRERDGARRGRLAGGGRPRAGRRRPSSLRGSSGTSASPATRSRPCAAPGSSAPGRGSKRRRGTLSPRSAPSPAIRAPSYAGASIPALRAARGSRNSSRIGYWERKPAMPLFPPDRLIEPPKRGSET